MSHEEGAVVRQALPTWEDHLTTVRIEALQEAIEMLYGKGLVGAAHALSLDTYGYGMEDTDDIELYREVRRQTSDAEEWLWKTGRK